MAIPTAPTSTSIATEALKQFGISTPSSAELTRAIDYGLELVKKQLVLDCQVWKFLQTTSYFVTRIGVSKYQLPTDYSRFVSLRMMDGARSGTAQSVTSTSVTLTSSDSASESDTIGKYLLITSGTSSGLALQVDDYTPSTRVAVMEEAFSITPTGTPTYLITDTFTPVEEKMLYNRRDMPQPQIRRMPSQVITLADSAEGDLFFNYTPDKVYGCELTYFSDLGKLDLTSTLYSTFLRTAQSVLTQGLYVWALNRDDSRFNTQNAIYNTMRLQFRARYGYGQEMNGMQIETSD